jgi:hypothetical protein
VNALQLQRTTGLLCADRKDTPEECRVGAFCSLTQTARFRLKFLKKQTARALFAHATGARFEFTFKEESTQQTTSHAF